MKAPWVPVRGILVLHRLQVEVNNQGEADLGQAAVPYLALGHALVPGHGPEAGRVPKPVLQVQKRSEGIERAEK